MVPRLWHYGGGALSYAKIQHLCPFCGTVMYETGGGVKLGCLAPLLILPLLAGLLFILITFMQAWR